MFVVRYIGRSIDTLLDRIFSVAGALVLSQFPEFMKQYYVALSGAFAEAARNLEVFRAQAQLVGKSLEELIDKHLRSTDPDFQATGRAMQSAVERYEDYAAAHAALGDASVWTKPFVFFANFDAGLMKYYDFTPGVPLSIEGAVYAFFGILLGLGVYHLFRSLPVKLFGSKKKT